MISGPDFVLGHYKISKIEKIICHWWAVSTPARKITTPFRRKSKSVQILLEPLEDQTHYPNTLWNYPNTLWIVPSQALLMLWQQQFNAELSRIVWQFHAATVWKFMYCIVEIAVWRCFPQKNNVCRKDPNQVCNIIYSKTHVDHFLQKRKQ